MAPARAVSDAAAEYGIIGPRRTFEQYSERCCARIKRQCITRVSARINSRLPPAYNATQAGRPRTGHIVLRGCAIEPWWPLFVARRSNDRCSPLARTTVRITSASKCFPSWSYVCYYYYYYYYYYYSLLRRKAAQKSQQ